MENLSQPPPEQHLGTDDSAKDIEDAKERQRIVLFGIGVFALLCLFAFLVYIFIPKTEPQEFTDQPTFPSYEAVARGDQESTDSTEQADLRFWRAAHPDDLEIAFYWPNENLFAEESAYLKTLTEKRTDEWKTALQNAQSSILELPTLDLSRTLRDSYERMPETLKFATDLSAATDHFAFLLMEEYDRARPYQANVDLAPVFEPELYPSLPSLTAVRAYTFAETMSRIDPEAREVVYGWADEVVRQTEIAGLHYPSDGLAAKDMVRYFFEEVSRSEEFTTALESATEEYMNLMLQLNEVGEAAETEDGVPTGDEEEIAPEGQ